ncbi:MAG: sulfatase-like hydrolase/transferase [Pirellulaceae bacterium]|nr:sulfatase-like hydrolase/transferase [Planctomycetales bacterium]
MTILADNRRNLWLVICVAIATSALAHPHSFAASPNVVLIISDDQMWTDFGFMGHPVIRTPRLDELARESLTFTHGYVPSSLCRPSLASIITGLYPHQHRITSNDPALPRGPRFEADYQRMVDHIDQPPALPRLLGQHGYVSMQTGKWWEGNFRRGGFTHGMTHGDRDRGGRHGDEGLTIGRQGLQPIAQFLEKNRKQPFLIWYAPFLPHAPHNPPQTLLDYYRDKTDSIHVARYWAMCEWFDQTVGELLDLLESHGHTKDTIVAFVTDNGWIQSTDRAAYAAKSKRSPFDGGLRTPIMIRWPDHVAPKKVDTPVSSIDLAPTILHACGVTPNDRLPGINLLDANAVNQRTSVMGEIFLHNTRNVDHPADSLTHRWIVADGWKLIVPTGRTDNQEPDNSPPSSPAELYHIIDDVHEERNLAAEQPERVATLRQQLDAWWSGE